MSDLARLKRIVLSLPDPVLRVAWLDDKLRSWPIASAARLLNGLCEASERSDPEAREALLAVSILFCSQAGSPLLDRLREQVAEQHLLALERLLRRAPPAAPEVSPGEAAIPDYRAGRELTLGERRSLARRPERAAFEALLRDPHPLVIRLLLANPKLTEDDVVRLVARRPARSEVLREVARAPRWLSRGRVRLTMLLNPGTPAELAIPLVAVCSRVELRELLQSSDTPAVRRALALELLEKRPPLPRRARVSHLVQ
jgi:hypothetical protein